MEKDGTFERLTKKEVIGLRKETDKLEKFLSGIKDMRTLPEAVFVVDPMQEKNAVLEARKLGIPVVGIVDTNCDPDLVDIIIPGNDDAIRSIRLIVSKLADAFIVATGGEVVEQQETEQQDRRPRQQDRRPRPQDNKLQDRRPQQPKPEVKKPEVKKPEVKKPETKKPEVKKPEVKAAPKKEVLKQMGINPAQFVSLFETQKDLEDFVANHERAHIKNKDSAKYPRFEDGKLDLMNPKAIEIEKAANLAALSQKSLDKLNKIKQQKEENIPVEFVIVGGPTSKLKDIKTPNGIVKGRTLSSPYTEVKLYITKEGKVWKVRESKSHAIVGQGKTQKEAINNTQDKINNSGVKNFEEAVKKFSERLSSQTETNTVDSILETIPDDLEVDLDTIDSEGYESVVRMNAK